MEGSTFPRLILSLFAVLSVLVTASSQPQAVYEVKDWAAGRVLSLESSLDKPLPNNLEELLDFAGVSGEVDAENYCLAQAIYFEARSEPVDGQFAVGRVVMNRVADKRYPDNICGVVFQNQKWVDACQFSFACDDQPDHPYESEAWHKAKRIANLVHSTWLPDDLGDATHYHADYVNPGWASRLHKTADVGRHIFYRYEQTNR